jgi:superfamily II DNA or RNA helicase
MTYAVGSLVRARGREWVVLPGSDDELVKVRPVGGVEEEATGILTELERVESATFGLPDPAHAGDEASARLLRDALRLGFRSSAGPFRSIGQIAVTPRPYQLVPLLMALRLDPVRLLIADDVGIGKTVEALLIARELLDQGDIHRTAVLCSPHLAPQWQAELRDKFHIDAAVVLPSTARKLEEHGLGRNRSLFEVYPHVVVSTDFIKADRRRDEFLRTCPEFVIVDEAHTCADPGTAGRGGHGRGRHQRHELLRGLAEDPARHLVLVTATPHSGNEDAFRSLLRLLDPAFADLPADLAGAHNEPHRRRVARHLVQRRRADIRTYLEDTPFPRREDTEVTYQLSPEYRRFLDRLVDYARESVADVDGGSHHQRVRWWSALALLRSVASSPAAAAETLRNRAAPAGATTPEEADELGRRTVLDQADEDAAETVDVAPGSDYTRDEDGAAEADPEAAEQLRVRRRLLAFAREAEALGGELDAKLHKGARIVRELLDDGFHPIVFCRFIPTAEYVAAHLRSALGKGVHVEAVTGALPPAEREARIAALAAKSGRDGKRVLVATDCLSEGINLQEHFSAVVHYDLSWNPTRHEQREGRVDRFGQEREVVRAVTYYGTDTQIDGIVLDVLLRKHRSIRSSLGISVPVPVDTNSVVEAIFEGLLLRGRDTAGEQLRLEGVIEPHRDELFARWDDAASREQRSRTMFAQDAIDPREVAQELAAVREAIGSDGDVERFTVDALRAHGAVVRQNAVTHVAVSEAPQALRDAIRRDKAFRARFRLPVGDDTLHLARTHPVVEGLASHVLDTALDPLGEGVANRCGAIRTSGVSVRTTLLLVRYRFHLVTAKGGAERPLLAEDAEVLAFTGSPAEASWLGADATKRLLDVRAEANVPPELASRAVERILDDFDVIRPVVDARARERADALKAAHRRVREAADLRTGTRYRVEPQLPADVLGIYVYLPVVG